MVAASHATQASRAAQAPGPAPEHTEVRRLTLAGSPATALDYRSFSDGAPSSLATFGASSTAMITF